MSRPSPDLLFANLAMDYLATADRLTAGVPASSVLARSVLDSGTVQSLPALVITADELPGGTTAKRQIQILLALLFQNQAAGSDVATDAVSRSRTLTRSQAAEYLDLIESRLLNFDALDTFLASLSTERRDGWRILKVRRVPQPNLERKEKPVQSLTLFAAVVFEVLWHPAV